MSDAINACKQWLNEVNWDMIHTDAVTMYLEWGNNNWHDAMRQPVATTDAYSIYFVIDSWEKDKPKVALMKMNKWGSQTLCQKYIPADIAKGFLKEYGNLKGIHELTPAVKEWLVKELEG